MKWVSTNPETLIQPRTSPATHSAELSKVGFVKWSGPSDRHELRPHWWGQARFRWWVLLVRRR